MTMRFSFLTATGSLLATLLTTPPALAQAGAACNQQSRQIEHRNACAVQRFQQADTAQNILYADVMYALSAHERPALRKDQSAWSRQRSSTCKQRHASEETQERWQQHFHDCLTQLTDQRRQALLHWLHSGQAPDS